MRAIYGTRINALTSGSITASTEESNFEATRIQDNRLNVKWRTTSGSAQSIVFDFGSALSSDSIMIAGHNFTSAGSIYVQANSADSWASPGLSAGLTIREGVIIGFFTSTSARYWRLALNDTTDTYVEIGKILLQEYYEFSPTSIYEFPFRRPRTDSVSYSQGRQMYSDVGIEYIEVDYNFPESTDAVKGEIETLWTTVGKHTPFAFMNFNTTYTVIPPIYCSITNDVVFQKKMTDRWIFDLSLRECK